MDNTQIIWVIIYVMVAFYLAIWGLTVIFPEHSKKGHFVPFENVLYAIMATGVIWGVYNSGKIEGAKT